MVSINSFFVLSSLLQVCANELFSYFAISFGLSFLAFATE